ncbi:MAG TPA: transposase [Baekduia sp.]|nr:transposase [Baekduia sp.]
MPPTRFTPPDRLPGATYFSRDRELSSAIGMVRLLKSQAWVWSTLRERTTVDKNWGRRREAGHWVLACVAFVVSGHVDVQPWHDQTTDDLWRECGFDAKPPYGRVMERFGELREFADVVLAAVGTLVKHARRHEPRVGAHIHIDGTEDETHAALVHDCEGHEPCPQRGKRYGRGYAGTARRPQRELSEVAREHRQDLAGQEPAERASDPRLKNPDKVRLVRRDGRVLKRVLIGGCWYVTRDTDAGIRAYMGPRGARRFWHGYYSQKAVDHFTGAVVFPGVYNASYQEYDVFDDMYDNVRRLIGNDPETIVGDRGYSVASVFTKLHERGVAPVIPWRASGGDGVRHDHDRFDRHGVVRCKHCGGPTHFVRHAVSDKDGPRLWVRCMLGVDPGCAKDQTISLRISPRYLTSLWRTDPLYHELRASHDSYEAVHDWWRDRYRVAGTGNANRPKAIGIGGHRLRANVACLIEWLRICHREGWLGSARRNPHDPERKGRDKAIAAAGKFADMRARMSLGAPYGEAAERLKLGDRLPPSRRPRGAPVAAAT